MVSYRDYAAYCQVLRVLFRLEVIDEQVVLDSVLEFIPFFV
jgi:hypothetical protein